MESKLKRLLGLLGERFGNTEDGYYGTVRVDGELINLLTAAGPELDELMRFKARLEWLHSGSGSTDSEGFEWGVARVKFNESGQCSSILWTNSDHSDLDAEMTKHP